MSHVSLSTLAAEFFTWGGGATGEKGKPPPDGQGKRIKRNPTDACLPQGGGSKVLGGLLSHGIPGGALRRPPLKSRSREWQRGATLSPPRVRPKGSPGSSGEGSPAFEPLSDPKGRPSSGTPMFADEPHCPKVRRDQEDPSGSLPGEKGLQRGKCSSGWARENLCSWTEEETPPSPSSGSHPLC